MTTKIKLLLKSMPDVEIPGRTHERKLPASPTKVQEARTDLGGLPVGRGWCGGLHRLAWSVSRRFQRASARVKVKAEKGVGRRRVVGRVAVRGGGPSKGLKADRSMFPFI